MSGGSQKTRALRMPDAMPVRTLLVEVVSGDDKGKRWEGERGSVGSAEDNALCLGDETVSRYHVRLSAEADGVRVVDLGSTNGTFVGDVRVREGWVPPGTTLRLGKSELSIASGLPATVELHDEDRLGELLGRSQVMRRLMSQVRKVAQSQVSVLIVGESGTGKELLARAVHDQSPRANGPFVTVDCASVTPTLVASELFGHEAGAFTGAVRSKVGAFETANGGTLFLDEVGELPAELQPVLLGALERRRFCRVGSQKEVSVDVHVVAATNRDLRAEVNNGSFRLDLYHRLAVVSLEIPPLRERTKDIGMLIEHFVRQEGFEGELEQVLPDEIRKRLTGYPWPGNVRELKNYVQATVAMGEPMELRGDASGGFDALGPALAPLFERPYTEARRELLEHFEVGYLERLLERTGGNVAQAAREAGVARSHVNDLLRRHKLR